MRRSKKQCQFLHAQRRAGERYGINVSRHDVADIIQMIRSGKAIFVRRESLRITVWDISLHEEQCRVVYDKKRKMVVTFLPCGQSEVSS